MLMIILVPSSELSQREALVQSYAASERQSWSSSLCVSSAESVLFPLHLALVLSPAGGSKLTRGLWPGPAPSGLPFPLCKASEELGLDAPGELQRAERVTIYKLVKKMAWKC